MVVFFHVILTFSCVNALHKLGKDHGKDTISVLILNERQSEYKFLNT